MGQAKQRKAAKDAGRPWAPHMPVAVSSATGTNRDVRQMERLGQLAKVAEAKTREMLQAARAAPGDAARFDGLHAILQGAMGMMEAEVESGYAGAEMSRVKESIACRKGCSFCCHLAVEATIIEAICVWRRASQSPQLTANILETGPKTANVPALERWQLKVRCPMLGADGACQVYDVRPGGCRAYVSVDVAACEGALVTAGTPEEDLGVPIVTFPRKIETAISIGVRRACAAENLQSCNVELTGALYLLATDPTAASRWLAGEAVFQPYP